MSPLLLSVLLLASDPVLATAASDSTDQAAPVKKEKEKKICKDDPSYTGSRMKRKICLTAGEWEVRDARGVGNFGTSGRTSAARTQ